MKRRINNEVTAHDIQLLKRSGRGLFGRIRCPHEIQAYVNGIEYDAAPGTSSPLHVLKEGRANCFEGALFAAAALRMLGYRPLIVDMIAENDDDHVIALFKQGKYYGAVAKSNTTMLRYRDPIFRSLRELAMSYFPFYFNIKGQMTLRSYSNPVDLSRFDRQNWMTTEENLDFIGDYLYEVKHYDMIPKKEIRGLSVADDDIVKMCFSGAVTDGVYKPS